MGSTVSSFNGEPIAFVMIKPWLAEGAELVLEPTREHVDRSSTSRINIDARKHLRDHGRMPGEPIERRGHACGHARGLEVLGKARAP